MYPLPHQPYATRTLEADESNLLRRFTNTLTAAALHDYDSFANVCHGNVHEDTGHDWKRIKHHGGLTVYRDTAMTFNTAADNVAMINENGSVSSEEPPPSGQIQTLLCVGTIPGALDDVMHGVVSPTAADSMLKSSCIGDNLVDCCVLASIVSPTSEDPWRSLTLKWTVNAGPSIIRPCIRPRDFTYVESTGVTTNMDNERVGYHIIHSVVVPGTCPIDERAVVRGNMSLYHVFHQKSPNTVEVHVRAFWQLNGHMNLAVQTYVGVEAMIAVSRIRKYSQMKKLAWLNQQSHSTDSQVDTSCCSLCRWWVGGCFTVAKCCSVCQSVTCRRCSLSKLLRSYSPRKRKVTTARHSICRRCLRKSEEPVVIQQSKMSTRSGLCCPERYQQSRRRHVITKTGMPVIGAEFSR